MKQKTKIALWATGAVAAVALTAGAAALVTAWGDNGGGRPSYTLEEINNGALGDTITLNSISDNPNIGDEKNFVGARLLSDTSRVWNANSIEAVDGETYVIRAYVHNNSPKEYDAVARGPAPMSKCRESYRVPTLRQLSTTTAYTLPVM